MLGNSSTKSFFFAVSLQKVTSIVCGKRLTSELQLFILKCATEKSLPRFFTKLIIVVSYNWMEWNSIIIKFRFDLFAQIMSKIGYSPPSISTLSALFCGKFDRIDSALNLSILTLTNLISNKSD